METVVETEEKGSKPLLLSSFLADEAEQTHSLFAKLRQNLRRASKLKIRLIRGEAFGFPIKVNVEMVAISTEICQQEFVLETPSDQTHRQRLFVIAIVELLNECLTSHCTTFYLFGFEQHRWVKMEDFLALLGSTRVWRAVQRLELDTSATTRETFRHVPPTLLKSITLVRCKIQDETALNQYLRSLAELEEIVVDSVCGKYLLPLLLVDLHRTNVGIRRLVLGKSHMFHAIATRALPKIARTLRTLRHLKDLHLEDDLPVELMDDILETLGETIIEKLVCPNTEPSEHGIRMLTDYIRAPQCHLVTLCMNWTSLSSQQLQQLHNALFARTTVTLEPPTLPFQAICNCILPFNRFFRPLLLRNDLPSSLWPFLLGFASRQSLTCLFCFLRERPEAVLSAH